MNGLPRVCPDPILEIMHGVDRTEIVYGACQLQVFDAVQKARKPITASELADRLQLDETNLSKVLDACVPLGLLHKRRELVSGRELAFYSNTELATAYLTEDHNDFTLLGLVAASRRQLDIEAMCRSDSKQEDCVWQTEAEDNERMAVEKPDTFREYYLQQDAYTRSAVHLLRSFDLTRHRTCVDLGGGIGSLSRALMLLYHGMKVACVDFPRVIDLAKKVEAERGHMKINHANTLREFEVDYTPCDMWRDELPSASLFVLSRMLSALDDDRAAKLLNKVYDHTTKDGAILVMEKVLQPTRDSPETATTSNVRLMGMVQGGRERTLQEYTDLLTKAGYHYVKMHHNDGTNLYDVLYAQRAPASQSK